MRPEQYMRIGMLAAVAVFGGLAALLHQPYWIMGGVFGAVILGTGAIMVMRGRERGHNDGGHFEDGQWVDHTPDIPKPPGFLWSRGDGGALLVDAVLDVMELLESLGRRKAKPDDKRFKDSSDDGRG